MSIHRHLYSGLRHEFSDVKQLIAVYPMKVKSQLIILLAAIIAGAYGTVTYRVLQSTTDSTTAAIDIVNEKYKWEIGLTFDKTIDLTIVKGGASIYFASLDGKAYTLSGNPIQPGTNRSIQFRDTYSLAVPQPPPQLISSFYISFCVQILFTKLMDKTESKGSANGLKSLQTLRDCKTVAEVDFSRLEIIRGETPPDISDRCLQLCKDYLADIWCEQTIDSILVNRLTGGLTNQLYYCAIRDPNVRPSHGVPREVAVRLYGSKYVDIDGSGGRNERLPDIIVALLASRCRLGPKIYGLFTGGEILAFYKHRPFHVSEQRDSKLVEQVFKGLSQWHAMDVPVKRRHWLSEMFDHFYDMCEQNIPFKELAQELNCETFVRYDLKGEKEFIKDLITRTDSPMVFTHNDFRSSNILIVEDRDESEAQVVFCDFDGSGYGYRGQDFGSIMFEWGRTWDSMQDLHTFPDDTTIILIIECYNRESERIYGTEYSANPRNSVKQMLIEN
ncbi:unnamed protein product [Oppiella nova]|uniref:Uncharacterized protein n=1 Tax=Oppiella nova TaxID=334625 RepID=A0A7R9MBX0_9ACAR|nr:unnamed protein product [Oppiella nova]CAG2174543.1 unnamed protein product [Oppiella nova]